MKDKRKVIIDTDPGIDDALALMLACASDELDILGVTIAAGNVDNAQCAKNALDILHLMGRDDIPVYTGSLRPLVREPEDARETHGSNGVGDYTLEDSGREAKTGAVEFMRDTLLENDGVSVITLGPLTNLATLIEEHPEAADRIEELVMMGGAFKSHGNCSPVAEFNVWFDPDAAKIVFDKLGKPITMTGLDVTRQALLTPNYAQLIRNFGGDKAEAIYGMVQFYTDFHWDKERVLGSVINDPLAVAQFLDPTICSGKECFVEVVTEGPAAGMTMVDEMGITGKEPNCLVLTECDHKRFFEMFMDRIFPGNKADIERVVFDETYGK